MVASYTRYMDCNAKAHFFYQKNTRLHPICGIWIVITWSGFFQLRVTVASYTKHMGCNFAFKTGNIVDIDVFYTCYTDNIDK